MISLVAKKTAKKYQQTKRGHVMIYMCKAKQRAKHKNLDFDLDLEYLLSIAPDECPVFNTKFIWGRHQGGQHRKTPSLDRIIPELGYIKGNVVFISLWANIIKADATEKELYAVADWLHDKRKEVLENVKPKPITPLPDEDNWEGEMHPQHRTISTPRSGKDSDDTDHYSGTVYWENSGDCTEKGGGDSVGHGDQEVGTFVTSYDIQDNWELHPTYGWVERTS